MEKFCFSADKQKPLLFAKDVVAFLVTSTTSSSYNIKEKNLSKIKTRIKIYSFNSRRRYGTRILIACMHVAYFFEILSAFYDIKRKGRQTHT